jgi:hypothetical protein
VNERAWRAYRRADFPASSWAVEGEVLHALAGAEAVSLISRQRYGDFDLSLAWRLPAGGNSGILYRVTEGGEAPWQSGPEMQLLGGGHPDGGVPETSCGALYGLCAPQQAASCATGLFNIARVSMRGWRVEHWLNGARVLACDLAGEDFQARVARSKFRGLPQFGRAAEGHIVLQHHGTDAWFHDIRVERAL